MIVTFEKMILKKNILLTFIMGCIYEIICWTTGLRYIGQTKSSLNKRLSQHKCLHKCDKNGSSKFVLEHGNYEIYELEKVEDELLREREIYYIQHTDCVNINNGLSLNMKIYKKEYVKKHYEKTREQLKKYQQSEKGKAALKKADKKRREKKKKSLNK